MQSSDKVFFTMDLLTGGNVNKDSVVQSYSAPPVSIGVSEEITDDDFIVTPPDQSGIIIPQELVFVRKPVVTESDELHSLVDDYGEQNIVNTGVSETDNSSDEDEFVYTEPKKVAPVDESLVFIRKEKPVDEDTIIFDDADIMSESTEAVSETETIFNVDKEQPIEQLDTVVVDISVENNEILGVEPEEDSFLADTLALYGLGDDGNYDLFGFEDLDEESDDLEIDYSNTNSEDSDIELSDSTTENADEDVVYADVDGEILYKSDDTKYNENKYRSDNIIRDYEEDNKYNYPLIYLSGEKIELFRVQALTGMLDKRSFIDTDELYYHVYVDVDGSVVYLGKLLSKLLRTVLNNQTFSTFNKRVYLNKDTSYEGDMLYALSELDISLLM